VSCSTKNPLHLSHSPYLLIFINKFHKTITLRPTCKPINHNFCPLHRVITCPKSLLKKVISNIRSQISEKNAMIRTIILSRRPLPSTESYPFLSVMLTTIWHNGSVVCLKHSLSSSTSIKLNKTVTL